MVSLWSGKVWKSILTTKLPRDVTTKSVSNSLHVTPTSPFIKENGSCLCLLNRSFHLSVHLRLKTLFSETEQSKIINFVNKLNPEVALWKGKLRPFNKIAETLPEEGPITDVNDLMERYSLSTSSAVSLCKSILMTNGDPGELLNSITKETEQKKRKAVGNVSRKLAYLQRTVKPEVTDPKAISSFTSIVVSEKFIAYAMLEKRVDWSSQVLTDWNVHNSSDLSQNVVSILGLVKLLPKSEHYVIARAPNPISPLDQSKLHGIILALLCAKDNFREDVPQKIFEVGFKSASRYFNLVVGNEIVSAENMVSDHLKNQQSCAGDHVYSRSLKDTTIAASAVEQYKACDDDTKESLSMSLIVAKAFVEILRV